MGQPHHPAPRGPCGKGLRPMWGGGSQNPKGWLGGHSFPAAGPRRGWGAAPLASYIKGRLGRAAAPMSESLGCVLFLRVHTFLD